jgi:hypothetical protein
VGLVRCGEFGAQCTHFRHVRRRRFSCRLRVGMHRRLEGMVVGPGVVAAGDGAARLVELAARNGELRTERLAAVLQCARVVLRVAPARLHVGRLLQRLCLRRHTRFRLQKPLRELSEPATKDGAARPSDTAQSLGRPLRNFVRALFVVVMLLKRQRERRSG